MRPLKLNRSVPAGLLRVKLPRTGFRRVQRPPARLLGEGATHRCPRRRPGSTRRTLKLTVAGSEARYATWAPTRAITLPPTFAALKLDGETSRAVIVGGVRSGGGGGLG